MGHLSGGKEEAYEALAQRLSRFPVGVVINDTLMEILKLLYTEGEAQVGSKFPVKPRPLTEIADLTGLSEKVAVSVLNEMSKKGLVVDFSRKGNIYYMLSPVVVGFFEYSMMRADGANVKQLSGLYEEYFNNEAVREEIFGANTAMFRALVYEYYIPELIRTEVLDYEKAEMVIRNSGGGGLSICACRHKSYHLGKTCRYPMKDICTSLGRPAEWLIRHGFARRTSVDELLSNLESTYKLGLVLACDNVIDEPAYICHCCGCCCGLLKSIKENGISAVEPSNFMLQIDSESCLGCNACVDICHVSALESSEEAEPALKREVCIGCGACVSVCPGDSLRMVRSDEISTPPQNKMAQMINIAVERGRF